MSLEPPDGETVDVLDDDDLENFDFGKYVNQSNDAAAEVVFGVGPV